MQSKQCDQNSEQDIIGVTEEEHKHILSVRDLQANMIPLTHHVVLQCDSTTSIQAREDGGRRMASTSRLTPPIVLSSLNVLQYASGLELLPSFYYLYAQALTCVQRNGPYLLNEHNSLVCAIKPAACLSKQQFAQSLALAQDCHNATQSCQLVSEDLKIHSMLGKTTIIVLERLLDLGELTMEPFAWGVLGLSSGYTSSDSLFDTYKQQLYIAVNLLSSTGFARNPSVSTHRIMQAQMEYARKHPAVNRQIHRSATMLLQIMRGDWTQLRWYHGVQVARRWTEHLEIISKKEQFEDRRKE
jgi:hypothetical protein